MAGAARVPVTLRPPDFRPDIDALRAAITGRTRLILLNTPHNPTGVVFTPDELAAIAALACEHDLLVVSDEVYEHMVYDGSHLPIVSLPGMPERTVTISSAAKMFSFTGWKIGWVTGSPELVTAVRTVKQFLTYVSGGPFQYAVAEALALPDDFYASISADLRVKRDFFGAGLAAAGFEVYWPAGTYFVTTDVRPLGYADGMEFCRELPGGPAWWPSPAWCSTTTLTRAGRRCGSPSARSRRSWPRRWAGSRGLAAARPGWSRLAVAEPGRRRAGGGGTGRGEAGRGRAGLGD